MKIHHFALLFIIFFLATVIRIDISIGKLKSIENEKAEKTQNLNSATSDAVDYLASTGTHGAENINKDEVVNTFFTSLYSSMGIISDTAAQAEVEMYIPVILLCDSDGYYVYYYDEYKSADGNTYSERVWSEKMPYSYTDEYFVYRFTLMDKVYIYDREDRLGTGQKVVEVDYHEVQKADAYSGFRIYYSDNILLNDETFELVKKGAIINRLEETMAYYTSMHNSIARRNGITYSFSFPSGKSKEWASYMDDINLLVVFQGYPYGADRNYTFNKIATAGANVVRLPFYYVEKKSWYLLAHIEGCEKIALSTSLLEDTFDSVEDCVKLGAYCCECIEHGARVPEIKVGG